MKTLLFLSLLFLFCALPIKAETPQWLIDSGCLALYQVPAGMPYNTKVLRPPFWTINRWECLSEGLSFTHFQNSPANGTDTVFYLALVFVINPPTFSYYPVLNVNESNLHIYTNSGTQVERFDFTIEQNTGKITFATAPASGADVYFEITKEE